MTATILATGFYNAPYSYLFDPSDLSFLSLWDYGPTHRAYSVAFTPDSSKLFIGIDDPPFLYCWNTSDWTRQTVSAGDTLYDAKKIRISPDSKYIGYVSTSRLLFIIDVDTLVITHLSNVSSVTSLCWSPDSKTLYARAHSESSLFLCDADNSWAHTTSPITGNTNRWLDFAYVDIDGGYFAVALKGAPYFQIRNTATLTEQILPTVLHTEECADQAEISVSSNNKYVAVPAYASPGLLVYDTSSFPWQKLPDPPDAGYTRVDGTCFDGSDLLAIHRRNDDAVTIYNIPSMTINQSLATGNVTYTLSFNGQGDVEESSVKPNPLFFGQDF